MQLVSLKAVYTRFSPRRAAH